MKSILAPLGDTDEVTGSDKKMKEIIEKAKSGKFSLFRGKGCDTCNSTGYKGRIGIFEVLQMSDAISKLILEHQSATQINDVAVSEGMLTLQQDGVLRVVEGVTTLEEVMRVAK